MAREVPDPRDVILQFLEELPITIQEGTFNQVFMYATGESIFDLDKDMSRRFVTISDLFDALKQAVNVRGYPASFSAVLGFIAAIDHVIFEFKNPQLDRQAFLDIIVNRNAGNAAQRFG